VVLLGLAAVATIFIDLVQQRARRHTAILDWRPTTRGLVYGAMVVPVIVFSGGTPVPFIYFRF
jgi:hypothetical protein